MIAKKNSRYNLERKRIVLFQIGLLTAGSFTLAAFNYSSTIKVEKEKKLVASEPVVFMELKEKPKKIEPKVQKAKVQNNQKSSSMKTNTTTQNTKAVKNTGEKPKSKTVILGPPGFPIDTAIVTITGDTTIHDIPDIDAEYIGGYNAMQKYVGDNLVYPQLDIEEGEQGTVYVSFVVETDGSVSNVKVERGVTPTIDREAKRIVRSFPKWKPGEDAYGKVRTRVRLPLNFLLE